MKKAIVAGTKTLKTFIIIKQDYTTLLSNIQKNGHKSKRPIQGESLDKRRAGYKFI